jgi:hypothetical protein
MRRVLLVVLAVAAASCSDRPAGSDGKTTLTSARVDGGARTAATDAGTQEADDVALPRSSSEELSARMRHLLEAISQNNPDLASDILFPRDAYAASKDLSDPAKAWERRLQQGFRRSIERMHRHMKGIDHAHFVSFELGSSVAQLTPKKKDFKKPLWRVKHSKLTLTIEGKTRHLDIAEMTAWRGAWYVTRLR